MTSYTDFRLVPKSVTLNDLERHNDRRPALSLRQLSFLYSRLITQTVGRVYWAYTDCKRIADY